MAIYFYSKIDTYGDFSNFSPHGIATDDLWWPTVEHYFQAQKFEDAEHREKIRRKKFETHLEIRDLLLGTGEEELIESAPNDYYWGCGKHGTGQNKLGHILM